MAGLINIRRKKSSNACIISCDADRTVLSNETVLFELMSLTKMHNKILPKTKEQKIFFTNGTLYFFLTIKALSSMKLFVMINKMIHNKVK